MTVDIQTPLNQPLIEALLQITILDPDIDNAMIASQCLDEWKKLLAFHHSEISKMEAESDRYNIILARQLAGRVRNYFSNSAYYCKAKSIAKAIENIDLQYLGDLVNNG